MQKNWGLLLHSFGLWELCLAPHLPAGQVFQLEDVHSLRVAGGTQELRVHTEHQRADCHIPRDSNTQADKLEQ